MPLTRLAFMPLGERVEVTAVERELGGPSFTVRTLEELRKRRPEDSLVLPVGADTLRDAGKWLHFERVRELAQLLVIPRAGETRASTDALDLPAPRDVSSTEVRSRLARGESVAGLVSPEVESYIRTRNLYRANPSDGVAGDGR